MFSNRFVKAAHNNFVNAVKNQLNAANQMQKTSKRIIVQLSSELLPMSQISFFLGGHPVSRMFRIFCCPLWKWPTLKCLKYSFSTMTTRFYNKIFHAFYLFI